MLFYQVSQHIRRIEALEKELKALTESAAGREDVNRVRAEMKKLYDGLHIGAQLCIFKPDWDLSVVTEFLDLKSHVWGIRKPLCLLVTSSTYRTKEQDLHSLSKKEGTSVRVSQ